MLLESHPLAATALALREGRIALPAYVDRVCDRVERVDAQLEALLPEPERRARLHREARELASRYPEPATRPPLFGVMVGVKDIFHVDGWETRAGSEVPAELFAGPEAWCVAALRAAGALVLGKTVTTEFAFMAPGPTRNPHNLAYTPGGSSSGSAAAVAAGICPLALGTQTVGSVIRPAAFCGIVGFKPTFDRIRTTGLIYSSPSLDTVGFFTQDVAGARLAASVLLADWRSSAPARRPVLGIPQGPYLAHASAEGVQAFEQQVASLQQAGLDVRCIPIITDFDTVYHRHHRLVAAEMARIHQAWFAAHAQRYRRETTAAIQEGMLIDDRDIETARAGRAQLRNELEGVMAAQGIDIWIAPSAPGVAPEGIGSTGNSVMNLPWTHAGMPALSLPAGSGSGGLPLGLQCVAASNHDEELLAWADILAPILSGSTRGTEQER